MKKFLGIVFLIAFWCNTSFSDPRTFLNLDEAKKLKEKVIRVEKIGKDQNGQIIPFDVSKRYLFGNKYYDSYTGLLTQISQKKIAEIFVKNKKKLEKNPHKTILGMAYFEFFYTKQINEKQFKLEEFENRYPNIDGGLKKVVKDLYNLNEVRRKMRQSIGFNMNHEAAEVINYYVALSKYLEKSNPKRNKLNKFDKQKIKLSKSFGKYLSIYEKNLELKKYNRINDKIYEKNLKKNYKKLQKYFSKIDKLKTNNNEELSNIKNFKILFKNLDKILSITNKNLNSKTIGYGNALDSIFFIKEIIKITKPYLLKNEYKQTWDEDFDIKEELTEIELNYLANLNFKISEIKKINDIKLEIVSLSLINIEYPINDIINEIEDNLKIKISPLKMNYSSIEDMKTWEKKDWSNSWRNTVPIDLKDSKGNLVNFSAKNIEDLKVQIAISNLGKILQISDFESLNIENENIKEIVQNIKISNVEKFLNQDFSITLDNYAKILAEDSINKFGNQLNQETINLIRENANFENLTAITNIEYGTNMTAEEYARIWENAKYTYTLSGQCGDLQGACPSNTWGDVTRGVDLINQLGSFDAAVVAKDLGANLQLVAESIAQAASVGISTDLEAAAQGLGYDSFSDAVSAYNEKYGTNYTVEEAKEALGN